MPALNDCIQITDKDHRGYGRVRLPGVDSCPHCGGCRWIRINGQRFDNPITATKLAYVIAGYTMHKEEKETGRKRFISYTTNSHEGFEPDYWQEIRDYYPCRCCRHDDLTEFLNEYCTRDSLTDEELAEFPHPADEGCPTKEEIAAQEIQIERAWATAA